MVALLLEHFSVSTKKSDKRKNNACKVPSRDGTISNLSSISIFSQTWNKNQDQYQPTFISSKTFVTYILPCRMIKIWIFCSAISEKGALWFVPFSKIQGKKNSSKILQKKMVVVNNRWINDTAWVYMWFSWGTVIKLDIFEIK